MPNPWDDRYRIRNLETIAGLQPGDKLDVTGTNEFKRQRRGAWTSIVRTFSHNKSSAYYAPIYKVFQETIISGFIVSNGSGAGINWDLIKRSLSGLRNLARTYENDRGKQDRLNRLVKHVETLVGLERSDGLPVHIVSRHRSVLRVEPNPHEVIKMLALPVFTPIEHNGFEVHRGFALDILDHSRGGGICIEGQYTPRGYHGIDFLAKKLGNDRLALRDLTRAFTQEGWSSLGFTLSDHSTYSNYSTKTFRPMFATPNGHGIVTSVGGDLNWETQANVQRRMQGSVVEALEITVKNRWRPRGLIYYDFARKTPVWVGMGGMACVTRSSVQCIELDVRATLRRAGENFVPDLHSAFYTVYSQPLAQENDSTPEWMLEPMKN